MEKIEDVDNYFKQNGGTVCTQFQERIKLKEIDIILTTSYGMKSVVFAKVNRTLL